MVRATARSRMRPPVLRETPGQPIHRAGIPGERFAPVAVAEGGLDEAAGHLRRVCQHLQQLETVGERRAFGRGTNQGPGGVDRLAQISRPEAADAVVDLERQPQRVHQLVASGAAGVGRVARQPLAHVQLPVGRGRHDVEVGRWLGQLLAQQHLAQESPAADGVGVVVLGQRRLQRSQGEHTGPLTRLEGHLAQPGRRDRLADPVEPGQPAVQHRERRGQQRAQSSVLVPDHLGQEGVGLGGQVGGQLVRPGGEHHDVLVGIQHRPRPEQVAREPGQPLRALRLGQQAPGLRLQFLLAVERARRRRRLKFGVRAARR